MTIVDTIADRHYGDKVKLAMAFAELLNQEARALETDGVDVIQFDEPAFNVYMDDVKTWGIEALHRAIEGLQVHDLRAHLLRLRHQGQPRLEGDARRRVAPVRGDLPGAGEEPDRPGLARVHPLARAARSCCSCSKGKDVLVGVIDVASDKVETPEEVAATIRQALQVRAGEAPLPLHQLRHGADGARRRARQAEGAGRGRRAGAEETYFGSGTTCR